MKIKLCREKYGLLTQCCTDNINQSISGTQLLPSKINRLIVNQLKCVENAKFKIKILKTTSLYFRLDTSSSVTTTLEISDSNNVGEGTGLEVFCRKNKQCFINLNWNIYEPITCEKKIKESTIILVQCTCVSRVSVLVYHWHTKISLCCQVDIVLFACSDTMHIPLLCLIELGYQPLRK